MEFKDLLFMLFFLFTIEVDKEKFYQKYGFCQGGPAVILPTCSWPPGSL